MKKTPGVVIYDGPSLIDGAPIVVVATFSTTNDKTGDMIQTWILRKHVNPVRAINTGSDASICGACPLRGYLERQDDATTRNRFRGCYVKVSNAPHAVWEAYQRGNYPTYRAEKHGKLFDGRKLRLGAYGDPVAAPLRVWYPIIRRASNWTGYTHQWRNRRFRRWSRYLMASTHTANENDLAHQYGFRTFRARNADDPIQDNEIVCPASDEAGKRRSCETCCACNGGRTTQKSIVILGHGSPSTMSGFRAATI